MLITHGIERITIFNDILPVNALNLFKTEGDTSVDGTQSGHKYTGLREDSCPSPLVSTTIQLVILDSTVHHYFPFTNTYSIKHHYICLCSSKRSAF